MITLSASQRSLLRVLLAIGFSAGILFFLLTHIDADIFLSRLNEITPYHLGMICGIYLLRTFVRALRFSIVIKSNLKVVYMISAIHTFLNKILPLRSGELTWPFLMKKYANVNFGNSVSLLFLLRYLDIFCVIFLFTIAALVVKPFFVKPSLLILLGIILIVQIVSLFQRKFLTQIVSYGIKKIRLPLLKEKLENLLKTFCQFQYDSSSQFGYCGIMGILLLLTFLNWLTIYVMYYHFISMFQIKFGFLQVIVAASFVTLGNNLPINSFGTFGTFELTWTAGFILLGMSKDIAIPLGLFINVSMTLISCVVALIGYMTLTFSVRTNVS